MRPTLGRDPAWNTYQLITTAVKAQVSLTAMHMVITEKYGYCYRSYHPSIKLTHTTFVSVAEVPVGQYL